jgi:hypothetical protein
MTKDDKDRALTQRCDHSNWISLPLMSGQIRPNKKCVECGKIRIVPQPINLLSSYAELAAADKAFDEIIRDAQDQFKGGRKRRKLPRLFYDEYGHTRDWVGFATFASICVCVLSIMVGGCMWLAAASCHSRWRAAGIETSWGPLQECVIRTRSGEWLPEAAYRDVTVREGK